VSRTGISVQDDARWVFNRLARDYARRPGYPEALVARLSALAGGPGARVADLGAGTGLLSVPLAEAGLRVWAVEPAREMLQAVEAEAATLTATPSPPGTLTPVHAAGEATGLPAGAFDLVVLADALHWMDAERAGREARRLLRPGGVAAVVVPRLAATPFLDALSARLAALNPRARPALPPVALFLSHARAAPLAVESFVHEARLSGDDLDAVLRSLSLVGPALGPAGVEALLAEARALAAGHGGAVWRREIALHAGRGS
jgi:SAM-dependent methyltransferase